MLELQFEELHRLGVRFDRAMRDLELFVEPAQIQIRRRYCGDQRQQYAAPCFLRGEQVRARRLGLAADAAPQIDLPARRRERLVARVRVVLSADDEIVR